MGCSPNRRSWNSSRRVSSARVLAELRAWLRPTTAPLIEVVERTAWTLLSPTTLASHAKMTLALT